MDNGGNLYSYSSGNRGNHNGSNTNSSIAWDIWELNSSRFDWTETTTTESTSTKLLEAETAPPEIMYPNNHNQLSLYACDGYNLHPDPHLMCLKLGKRHYFEDGNPLTERQLDAGGIAVGKRGRGYCGGGSSAMGSQVMDPSCQVEGCDVSLLKAKDYHKRHKVCEMHSKAPKVIVLGLEQRFCQQCSRFHGVSEFDDSKRSCRRRLAGHNERRRKNSHESTVRNPCTQSQATGRALSLLSSKSDSWVSPVDLSSRSSAALRELIAENRAAILARQLVLDRDWHLHQHAMDDFSDDKAPGCNSLIPHQNQLLQDSNSWDRFQGSGTHLTLELMQAPNYGFLSASGKMKEEECCSELWNSLDGAHLV